MLRIFSKTHVSCLLLLAISAGHAVADIQGSAAGSVAPRVLVPTGARPIVPVRAPAAPAPTSRILYPWKLQVTCTIFWIGEQPSARNPTPNSKSSWDQRWTENFGGYDDPEPANRLANHTTGEFRPKAFVPKLNPFYIALPYNDVIGSSIHKPEAARGVRRIRRRCRA